MLNEAFAAELEKIIALMSMIGDKTNQHKIFAYQKAIKTIRAYSRPIEEIDSVEKLNEEKACGELKGVGGSTFEKLIEFVKTGKLTIVDELRKLAPPETITEFTKIRGIGAVGAKKLWETHKVTTLEELIKKLESGEIEDEKLLMKAKKAKEAQEWTLFEDALEVVEPIVASLRQHESILRVEACGGIRRKKSLVHDADLLCVSKNVEETQAFFAKFGEVQEQGSSKMAVEVKGFRVELTFTSEKSWWFALLHFTGSMESNVRLRGLAIDKGLLLNQDGIFNRDTKELAIEVTSEKEIFEFLGAEYLTSELRDLNPTKAPKNLVG